MAKIYPSYESTKPYGVSGKGHCFTCRVPLVMRMRLSDECLLTQGPTTGYQGVVIAWK